MKYTQSEFDPNQISRMGFDDEKQAHRVIIEGSSITIPELKIPEIQFPSNLEINNKVIEIIKEVPVLSKEVQVIEVEKPVVIKETDVQIVEIVKEIPIIKEVLKVETVEKPVIIPEIQIQVVERPVIIEKTIEKMSSLALSVIAAETVGLIILTILLLK